MQLLLDSFQYATTLDVIPPDIMEDEHQGKLKVWDEQTSMSPTSHVHFGHLKAIWAEHTLLEGEVEATALEEKQKCIIHGHILLLRYAL